MPSLPYMQLYVADYLADTLHIDVTESGAYLHLLMNYWQKGKPLEDNDKKLSRIAKCSDEQWLDIRSTVVEFFEIKDGFLYHKRIENDLLRIKTRSEQSSKAGKISAQKRKEKQEVINTRSTDVQHPFNHKDKDKDKETTTSLNREESVEKQPPPKCPHQEIVKQYNTILRVLPAVKTNLWNGTRKKHLTSRWKEDEERQNIEWWKSYFQIVSESNFLKGENDRNWKADLGWLVNQTNMAKVIEGKYKNKKGDDYR